MFVRSNKSSHKLVPVVANNTLFQGLTAQQLQQLNSLEALRPPLVMPVALRPSPQAGSPVSSTGTTPITTTTTPTATTPGQSSPSNVSSTSDETSAQLASLQLKYQQNLANQLSQYQLGQLGQLASASNGLVNCRCPPTQLACTCGASTLSLTALSNQLEAQKNLASQLELQKTLVSQMELQRTFASQLESQQKALAVSRATTCTTDSKAAETPKTSLTNQLDISSLSSALEVQKALTAQLEVQKTLATQLEAQKSLAYQLEAQKLLASHLETSKRETSSSLFNWRWTVYIIN